jgi:hypothetical protein
MVDWLSAAQKLWCLLDQSDVVAQNDIHPTHNTTLEAAANN